MLILYRINNWINEGSDRIIESMEGIYLNISASRPLIGSRYMKLLDELKNSMKGLVNIQSNDNKCFLCCHVRHLKLIDKNPQRITKKDNEIVGKLDYEGLNFPVSKKDYCRIELQNKICINVFCYDNKLTYPVYLSNQKFNDNMDLLFISNEVKCHYVYIKYFTDLCLVKQKIRLKNIF